MVNSKSQFQNDHQLFQTVLSGSGRDCCYDQSMNKTRAIVPALFAVAALISIALAVIFISGDGDAVRGQVVSVEPASVTTIASLTIREDSGKVWVFEGAETFSGFTPSHLNEHKALQEAITVVYEESRSGVLTIVSISD